MQLIYLDLESDRPQFIEDLTFNVIPNIEDFIDADFDFLDEDEIDVAINCQETGKIATGVKMRLYIIRHADPDYANRTITPQGHLEAEALADRLASQGLDRIYSSPLGRAIHTAQYTVDRMEMGYQVEDWIQEASLMLEDPSKGQIWAWDLAREMRLRGEILVTTHQDWYHQPPFDEPMFRQYFHSLVQESDRFLANHGYVREDRRYRVVESNQQQIALFCHGAFGLIWIAHLLEVPVPVMWSSFFLAPSSVTTILFDERSDQWAVPRCIGLADVSHLYQAGLPVQPSGIKANFY